MEEAGAWHRALAYGSAGAGPVTPSHISEVLHRAPDPGMTSLSSLGIWGFLGRRYGKTMGKGGKDDGMATRKKKKEKSWEPGWS